MVSRLGMFLYPILTGFFSCSDGFSWSSFSSRSDVSASPVSPSTDWVSECGGDADKADGDAERVLGKLTAVESTVDADVVTEVEDPVRRAATASLGRDAELLFGSLDCAPIKAASFSRGGGRIAPEGGLTVLSRAVSVEAIVVMEQTFTIKILLFYSHIID